MLALSCSALALSFGLNVPARTGEVRMAVEVRIHRIAWSTRHPVAPLRPTERLADTDEACQALCNRDLE